MLLEHATSTKQIEDEIIEQALSIIANRFKQPTNVLTNPDLVESYLRLHLAEKQREVFTVIYLSHGNGVIETKDMFVGTNNHVVVWPREIVKTALELNANSVILSHNHPSGNSTPSQKDIILTKKIHETLQLLGMAVVDHLIIGCDSAYSLRKTGEFNPHETD